jgi:hypothetical protein
MDFNLVCVVCNNIFNSRIFHQKTCSPLCRKKHRATIVKKSENKHKTIEKKCFNCESFYFTDREESVYCSLRCWSAKQSLRNKRQVEIKCVECDKLINKTKSNPKVFCNRECFKKHQRNEKIEKLCLECGEHFYVEFKNRNRNRFFCSKKCSTANKWKNVVLREKMSNGIRDAIEKKINDEVYVPPMKNKHHLQKTKNKISKTRKKNKKSKGENNPMFGRHHSKESCEKISKTRSQKIIEGHYPKWNKGIYYSIKMGKELIYRSSWEKIFYEMLEKSEIIISYFPEPVIVTYLFNGKIKHYIPDLLINYKNGDKKIVEIKPSFFLSYEINQAKFQAAQNYCQEKGLIFEVWTEKELSAIHSF